MTVTLGASSGARDVTAIHIGTASGVRTVIEGWIGTASGAKPFYSATPTPTPTPMSVTAAPDSIGWAVVIPGVEYVSNTDSTATPSGGTAPYTYAWSVDSGNTTIDSPVSPTTGFHSGDGLFATVSCTVTDALGNTATSNTVSFV